MLNKIITPGMALLLIGLLVFAAGCPKDKDIQASPVQNQWVSVNQAATSLGMHLQRCGPYSASMCNDNNCLLVLGPPGAGVMFNGKRIGDSSDVRSAGNNLFISSRLLPEIRQQLRQETPKPKPIVQAPVPPQDPWIAPTPSSISGTVMIDAGHGGRDPGAPNKFGPPEKIIALDIALQVRDLLAARGVRVIMTRDGDTYPELDDRVALGNKLRPDLFVSIHCNALPAKPSAQGYIVFVAREASSASSSAAQTMVSAMRATGASGGVQKADFKVIAKTTCPAILIETGFLTNSAEGRKLSTPEYRQTMARAISDGVSRHLQGQRSMARR